MVSVLSIILIIIEVVTCILLIGVILLQQSKSQGLGLAFGGGMGESLFGSRAGNVLTKITIILSIVFLANTTLLGIVYTSSDERSLVEKASVPAPAAPLSASAPSSDMMTAPEQQGTLFPTASDTPAMQSEVLPVTVEEGAATEVAPTEPVVVPEQESVPAEPVTTP